MTFIETEENVIYELIVGEWDTKNTSITLYCSLGRAYKKAYQFVHYTAQIEDFQQLCSVHS